MRRKRDPNRLLESGYMLLSSEPLVGVIVLDTDRGMIDFGVNREVATELRDNLNRFLEGRPSDGQGPVPGD